MSTKNKNRWRCLTAGCNPKLYGEVAADDHEDETGHRVAKWPVRSAEGKRRARQRNRSGYYDKYNVGAKSAAVRLGRPSLDDMIGRSNFLDDGITLSPEDRTWDS